MKMFEKLQQEFDREIEACASLEALEQLRVHYLGKQGLLTEQMKSIGSLPVEDRKAAGAVLNTLKEHIAAHITQRKTHLEEAALLKRLETERIDISQPTRPEAQGRVHPLSQAVEEIITILGSMGFSVAEGPDIEDDFHNFTALNIAENHPARQMHDTFYLPHGADGRSMLLRTHTSPVQIRTMEQGKPPFRIMVPGRTYRCDSDATHSPMFHQVEGLYIDKNIHMGHLKGCIVTFIQRFFETSDLPVRFRPSFFPFTEPSAEVDIGCSRAGGTLTLGAGGDWLEVLGCGMVHPQVLRNVGVDPEVYQGFAFGMGIERLAMLKYGIADLRTFFELDSRWLKHYGFSAFDIPSLVGGLTQ